MLDYIVSLKNHRNPSGLYDNNKTLTVQFSSATTLHGLRRRKSGVVLPSEEEKEERKSVIIIILSPTHHAVADDALLGGVAPAVVSPGTSLRDPPPSSLRDHQPASRRKGEFE